VSNGSCSVLFDIPYNAGGPGLISSQPGQSCVGWDWRPNGRDIAFFDALIDPANSASVVCGGAAVPLLFVGNSSGDQPYNGCTIAAGQALDVAVSSHGCSSATSPVSLPADSVQSVRNRYTSCSEAAVFSCTYTNSNGHAPPPPTSSAQAAIWTFFRGTL
jgi:hypothetical protein